MQSTIISTSNLSRHFGNLHAVDDISIEVRSGIVFGFLGPNGSGKTTTIRLLLGLLEPTSGKAQVLGYDTKNQSGEIRQRSGALLEHTGLYERMTAEDNLEFYEILLSGLKSTASISTGYSAGGLEKSRVSGSMIFNKTV